MQQKSKTPKFVMAALAAVIGMSALTACNTVKGAGEDVSATGDAVSQAAEETKDDMTK